ncbi:MAG: HAD family hydrolase [Planctomycetia bacterium]|nr:MAG: HAD family hydrolase [Planctomycetia bacterium]
MNFDQARDIFRIESRPRAVVPAGVPAVLRRLTRIRAVLVDVYGTLLASASGDVGTLCGSGDALLEALAAAGVSLAGAADQAATGRAGVAQFQEEIRRDHERSRAGGTGHPEIDVRQVWRRVLEALVRAGRLPTAALAVDVELLSVHYEAAVNPCWPMPHAQGCLEALHDAGLKLGIISNAQFYTPPLLVALFGQSLDALGFDRELQYYSYEHGEAKPGTSMLRQAAAAVRQHAARPDQVLYLGNDVLNDVWPACNVGFRTGLFAGDATSLRLRAEDPRVAGVEPDIVLTDWRQLAECILP